MPKVLVLDDQADIRFLIETILKMNGYEVRTASDKKQFLELLAEFRPELIILDVMLNGDDGRDICREIKAAGHRHIPVILYSANPDLLVNYKACHADDYLNKPFEIKDLLKKIRKNMKTPVQQPSR